MHLLVFHTERSNRHENSGEFEPRRRVAMPMSSKQNRGTGGPSLIAVG